MIDEETEVESLHAMRTLQQFGDAHGGIRSLDLYPSSLEKSMRRWMYVKIECRDGHICTTTLLIPHVVILADESVWPSETISFASIIGDPDKRPRLPTRLLGGSTKLDKVPLREEIVFGRHR